MLCILISNLIVHSTLFNVYAGYKIKFQTRPHCLRLFVSLHIQTTLRLAGLFLRQCGFRFFTINFLPHQLVILFVEEMAKRKVIVLPVNENNTFFTVIFAVNIELKLDYALCLVLMSPRGTRSNSRLDPIVYLFCSLTHSIRFAVSRFVLKTRQISFHHHQVSSPTAGNPVRWRDGKTRSL